MTGNSTSGCVAAGNQHGGNGTEKTPEINRFRLTGQVGQHETVPPKTLAADRASRRQNAYVERYNRTVRYD